MSFLSITFFQTKSSKNIFAKSANVVIIKKEKHNREHNL